MFSQPYLILTQAASDLSDFKARYLIIYYQRSPMLNFCTTSFTCLASSVADPDSPGSETFHLSGPGSGSGSEITSQVGSRSEIVIECQASRKKTAMIKTLLST